MQVWPFIPGQEVNEALEWRTDVIRARGTEQRIALRTAPRQSFEFSHPLTQRQYARARALIYGVGLGELLLPVWPERTRLSVSAGATSIAFDTAGCDYRDGGSVVLWANDEQHEAVTIDAVSPGGLTLAAPVAQDYASALVMPARLATAPEGLSAARGHGDDIRARLSFLVVGDSIDLGADPGYAQYRGHAVMTDPSIIAGALDEAVLREFESLDNEAGVIFRDRTTRQPTQRFSLAWHVFTRAALWDLRRWLHSRRGKQKGFWLPTWAQDFSPTLPIDAADTTITVRAMGYPALYGVRDVMIRTVAGATYYRRILSAAAGGSGTEVLTIDSALGADVPVNAIARMSLLHFVRHAADRVEILHAAAAGAAVSIPCEEVPEP